MPMVAKGLQTGRGPACPGRVALAAWLSKGLGVPTEATRHPPNRRPLDHLAHQRDDLFTFLRPRGAGHQLAR